MNSRVAATAAAALLAPLALSACGDDEASASSGMDVVTSFYPLQLAVQQIGGSHVTVTDLTKPGTEPHDLELSPKDVAKVSKADLLVYQKGISGAVDQTARNQAGDRAYDVSGAAHLDLHLEEGVGEEDHAGEGEEAHDHDHGGTDPHFWLDPVRYQGVASAVAERLSKADPEHRADYAAGLKSFNARLGTLSTELTTGLRSCAQKNLVTSHAAFGYLAARTGLHQVPIAGLSPESEPDAAHLAAVARYTKQHGIRTIYTETLGSPEFARTVARSTGATTAVLDPVEGITDSSAGKDYFEVMRSNLATLKKGQACT
ncbi:metal ABC transporter substrate-binding protein [Luteipulveratus sp. YIM 133132]|uniref:metal ABC transporter substrate-binding protein n=1 Tax=Luteipulveratus flavus TaxID=3031728 RepID=UPI0023AE9AF3|nr:metal ABC transporter substrate-binding protein [Luteipulveratus sp. YIM 133132]MDE9367548.1 metal ABC transporter substrate-binding protein [Luteipulveratus sp. YIM 133132]